MTKQLRAFGRNQIALHLPADFPHANLLRKAALFFNTYTRRGEIVAFDLVFSVDCRRRLESIVERLQKSNLSAGM